MRTFLLGGAALSAISLGTGGAAFAQQTPAGQTVTTTQPCVQPGQPPGCVPEEASAETIVVTGSRIARAPENAPTPVIQITNETILESGEQNIVDFLSDIPALQNSQVYEDTTGGFVGIGGLAFLNLRNLGSGRTLVLVDGRRHVAGDPAGARVDVDTIPTPLVERVEIVTGGASATYGADAVSGVVNFIMKDNFEGLQAELAVGQLTQGEFLTNNRASLTWGTNLLDNRLNVYAFAEYQGSDAVFDKNLDIGWMRNDTRIIVTDADAAGALNDGAFDNTPVSGLRSLNRPIGGILTLANGVPNSRLSDPDITGSNCTSTHANSFATITNQQGVCFGANPGYSYQFRPDGTPYLADFGAGSPVNLINRSTTIGGSGDKLTVVETNRLPEQEAGRFQVGANFDITDNLNAFGEVKYIDEQNIDIFQPHFTNFGIKAFPATPAFYQPLDTIQNYQIGLDNAYLPTSLRDAIIANQRTAYTGATATLPGQPITPTVNDQRAQLRVFSFDLGYRPAIADRTTMRLVAGLKGDIDAIGPLHNINWEAAYTYGVMEAIGTEPQTIDVDRFAYSADAVVDTLGEAGPAGAIVCRVKIMSARGVPIFNAATDEQRLATDPSITNCVPSRVFGTGGYSQAAKNYILTSIVRKEINQQNDATAYMTGQLGDYWNAGPIGVAFGMEGRTEDTKSNENIDPNVLYFGNSLGNLPKTGFDVVEFFAEVDIPILKDYFLVKSLDLSGAARTSNYSSIGVTDTWSASLFWQVTDEVAFRSTKGLSVRAPTISELYSPAGDTFPVLADGCSAPNITGAASATIRANRTRNCAQLGIPTTFVDPNPTASKQGKSGSNPNLTPEESESFTLSAIFTPKFAKGLTFVADYYDISINNAIATLSAQTLLNLCTDSDAFNASACGAFTRAPATAGNAFVVTDFLEGPFNFAGLVAKGIDFEAHYGFDTSDLFKTDYGHIDLGINGNYLIRRQDFTDTANPTKPTNIDATANNPRVRFRQTTTWSKGPVSLSWKIDFQESQELINPVTLGTNTDTREANLFTTEDFIQHDFSFRINLADGLTARGGVVNVFDAEPTIQAGLADNFDLFGRRFFAGVTMDF
ncbi:MAG TPA: TonB-dependent receptor [Hyphomonadaceae bacterium]|jgi:outer membrane receptor protein involved in Fe transport|nr:TonB-dependent receptor [Hyphomonadaceae bacterium]